MKHQRDVERGSHEVGSQRLLRHGGPAAASDHDQGRGVFRRWVSVVGAAGAVVVALMGLLGYVPGLQYLGSAGEGYIPMAPSTAISFIVLGGILLAMALRSPSAASLVLFGALAALVCLFGALEVAGHFTGRDLNFEDALIPAAGHLGQIAIGRMSPATGAAFFLGGLAVLALVVGGSRTGGRGTHLGRWGGGLGVLVLGISVLFCLAYVLGTPLLYGEGDTVPMALTTALAFGMLGAAAVGASSKGAVPMRLLAGSNRSGKPIGARRRFLLLTFIMVGACAAVMAIMTTILYRHEIQDQRDMLRVSARSQARLIEAVARYDANVADILRAADPGHDSAAATLSRIVDAHEQYRGFGETGEFALARREGDAIVFVMRHRHGTVEHPAPVAFDSDLAEPMRLALSGLSGTVIGLDYRGETVLAAYEPVAVLNLGIVAKIDLDEVRRPYIRSGLLAAAVALLVVLAGTSLFIRIGNPIITRLEAYSGDLEREIEERRRVAEDLHQYEHIVSSSADMLALMDKDHVYLAANPAYLKAFSRTSDEVIGRTAADVFGEEFFNAVIRPKAEACLAGAAVGYQDWFDFPVAGRKYMDVLYSPYRDLDGQVNGFAVIGRDITERKCAEEALLQSEERYRGVVEGTADLITVVDGEGRFTYVNYVAESVFGVDREQCIGLLAFGFVHPDDQEKTKQWFEECVGARIQQAAIENRQVNRETGAVTDMLWTVRFHYGDGGQLATVDGIARDITERKRAERQRLSLERQVQHAQKLESLGVLAGGIAHDFNNLLMTILGNADLALAEMSRYAPARENIEEIEKASKRAAELAKQMLAYSGKGRFIVEPIDLGELVEEISHLLEVSISKKAVIKYNFADNLPIFDGDATQIRQIIMNLITNASEALGEKSGVIAVSTGAMDCDRAYLDGVDEILLAGLDEPLSEGLYAYVEVADTGCGMDAETLEKIFDPFFTTKFTGRGLGMAAVLGIVRGHHGAIMIYSELGKGTTFKILFPAAELPANGAAIPDRDAGGADSWRPQGGILIADDEESVCAVGKQMLIRMGFSVLTAADGREAVEVFRRHADEIDCVLLDLTMPHMDGEEAFRELRRIQPDVAVILCSGYNEQEATERFIGKGLAGFIQKPYNMTTLREKLMEVLPRGGA